MGNSHILIVEDEPSIADNLKISLSREGFETCLCHTISNAREALKSNNFSLIVLDVGLPDGSGFDFCREIRTDNNIPIIMLTARSDEIDRVVGLEIGADDYVTKPFSPRELSARVRAVLRRTCHEIQKETSPKTVSNIHIDEEAFEASINGQALSLAPYEFRLLLVLAGSPGRIFSRLQLLEKAWKEPHAAMERTVDAHIKGLRSKIKKAAGQDLIVTHRGFGYSLSAEK